MPGLLINIKDLYKYNMKTLLKKINSNDSNYVIFIISDKEFEHINNLQKGTKTVEYMNSDVFLKQINALYYIVYNSKHNICELRLNINNKYHLKDVIDSIFTYLPKNVIIWTGLIDPKNYDLYIEQGFSHPYKCNKSPLRFKFENKGLAFIHKNSTKDKITLNYSSIKNKIKYLDIEDKNNVLKCSLYARFTPETVHYLQKINNPKSEKELSGSLVISKVISKDNNIIFELSSNPNSVMTGADEEVDAVWSRYNFHTHPKKAYENHGVKNGWPSSQDYVGFLDLKNHTIFHTVITLEGLYIISLHKEWTKNIHDINRKYILNHYDIDHLDNISPLEYVKKINSKKYKGKHLFDVKYMKWDNATNMFPVFFEKTNGSCLATDDNFDISQIN